MGVLQKWNNDNQSLTPERRLMNEALAQIAQNAIAETRRGLSISTCPPVLESPVAWCSCWI